MCVCLCVCPSRGPLVSSRSVAGNRSGGGAATPPSHSELLTLTNIRMDPRYTGEILRHLEKQDELLMDAYRSMSHEVHKLQVEEEMLMRKFFELMSPQCLNKKNGEDDTKVSDDSKKGQSSALITVSSTEQ
ncbi:unnamed protein product [Camellia sinensis]